MFVTGTVRGVVGIGGSEICCARGNTKIVVSRAGIPILCTVCTIYASSFFILA